MARYKIDLSKPGLEGNSFGAGFSSDIITILVGPEKEQFNVPSSHLIQVDFFAKAIEGGFKEATTKIIELPDEDPWAFKALLRWLYRGLPKDLEKTFLPYTFVSWVKVLVMADKWCLEKLALGIAKHVANLLALELHHDGEKRFNLFYEGFQLVVSLPHRYLFIDAVLAPKDNIWPAELFEHFADCPEFFVAYARYSAFMVEAQKNKAGISSTPSASLEKADCRALLIPLLFKSVEFPCHLLPWADREDASFHQRDYFRKFLDM